MVSGQSIFKHKIPSASDQLLLAMQSAATHAPMTTKAAFQTGIYDAFQTGSYDALNEMVAIFCIWWELSIYILSTIYYYHHLSSEISSRISGMELINQLKLKGTWYTTADHLLIV